MSFSLTPYQIMRFREVIPNESEMTDDQVCEHVEITLMFETLCRKLANHEESVEDIT